MIYGLYQSATGVLTNSYRQDVIANNLANAETVGFKRDVTVFQARLTEAQARRQPSESNPLLEALGGGIFVSPTRVDVSQGELEPTGNPLDLAIEGKGFFAVQDGTNVRLTRNGQLAMNASGQLVLATDQSHQVLDTQFQPITLDTRRTTSVDATGKITQDGKVVAQIGVFSPPDATCLRKIGGTLLACEDTKKLAPSTAPIRSRSLERANVDPTTELAVLMDAQRQLEANANMIRYQDQTLQRLVNEVGKVT